MTTPAISSLTPGTPRNNFTGKMGWSFTVGARDMVVDSLGIYRLSGNSHTRTVAIYAEGGSTAIASVDIDMSSGTLDTWKYGSLSSSIVLSAGVVYYIASTETSGEDAWEDNDAVFSVTSDITANGAVYNDGVWHGPNTGGTNGYSCSNFTYVLAPVMTDVDLDDTKIAYSRYSDVADFGGTKRTVRIDFAVNSAVSVRIARDTTAFSAVYLDGDSISVGGDSTAADPGPNSFTRYTYNMPDLDEHILTFVGEAYIRAIALGGDDAELLAAPGLNKMQLLVGGESLPSGVRLIGFEDFDIIGDPHPYASILARSGGTCGSILFRAKGKVSISYNDLRGYRVWKDRTKVVDVLSADFTDTLSPTSNYQWKTLYDCGDASWHDIILQVPFGTIQAIAADDIDTSNTSFPPRVLFIGDSITCGVGVDDYRDIWTYKSADAARLPFGASGIGFETMFRFPDGTGADINTGAPTYWAGDSDNRINQIIAQNPDILCVHLGANDVTTGYGAAQDPATETSAQFAAAYNDALVRVATALPDCQIFVLGIVPRIGTTPSSATIDAWNTEMSASIAGLADYIDPSGMSSYEIHPTAAGHAEMAALVAPRLMEADISTQTFTSSGTFDLTGKTVTKIQVWSAGSDGSLSGFGPGGSGGGYAETDSPSLVGSSLTITFEGGLGSDTFVTDDSGRVASAVNANGDTTPGAGTLGDIIFSGGMGGTSDGLTTAGGGGGCAGASGNGTDGTEGTPGSGGSGGGAGSGSGGAASIIGDGANGNPFGGGGGGSLIGNGGLGDTGAITISWTDAPTPPTPGVATAVSHTSSSATVSWTDATGGVGAITAQLQISAHSTDSWSNVSGQTTSPGTAGGLAASTAYDFRVAYTDTTPNMVYSNTVTITTDAASGGSSIRQKYIAEITTYGIIRHFFKRN